MILYKYVDFESALKILKSKSISFTKASQFNDPFEMLAISNYSYVINDSISFESAPATPPSILKTTLNMYYGVLSLTRNPVNNLMWSHYGDEHRGVAFGFDVDEAGFCDKEKNIIPANHGEIIYTKTFPEHLRNNDTHYFLNEICSSTNYSPLYFEFFKFAYLYKGIDWAYEEEVRVIKRTGFHFYDKKNNANNFSSNSNGEWHHIDISDKKQLNLFTFPLHAIKEVYFGSNVNNIKEMKLLISLLPEKTEIKCCALNSNVYNIVTLDYFPENKT